MPFRRPTTVPGGPAESGPGLARSTTVAMALFMAVLVAACGNPAPAATPTSTAIATPTPTPIPLPVALSADSSILDGNSLIARIEGTLDSAGHVYVEYWSDGVGRFRSRTVSSDGTRYTVHVVRLRANTEYSYQVFGDNLAGVSSAGPAGSFVTGELPEALKQASFDVVGGTPTHDLTFLEFRQEGFLGFAAFDGEGHIVWYFPGPGEEQPYVMAQKPDGNIVYIAGFEGGTTAKALVEVDPLGEEVDRLVDVCSPFGPIHHEVQILPDGRVMYLSREVLRPGYGDPPKPQEGDTIGIWDQTTGENRIVWNIFDFISPADRTVPDSNRTLPGNPVWGGCERDRTVQDWSHGNSAVMADDGSVLVSLGHLDQVVLIAPDFQSVRWRLGGPGSDFIFPDPRDKFYHQHTATPLANGNILVFDNGNFRPGAEGGPYSRALELSLDMESMTASKVWEFPEQPGIYAQCCSSAQRLENGNTLVLFGNSPGDLCCRFYVIVEVDPDAVVVWEVVHRSPGKRNQHRIYPGDSIWGEVRISDK